MASWLRALSTAWLILEGYSLREDSRDAPLTSEPEPAEPQVPALPEVPAVPATSSIPEVPVPTASSVPGVLVPTVSPVPDELVPTVSPVPEIQNCCCRNFALQEARRCLPVHAGEDYHPVDPVVVKAKLTETTVHGHKEVSVVFPPSPEMEDEKQLPRELLWVDPDAAENPTSTADEKNMTFTWARGIQWRSTCTGTATVGYVAEHSREEPSQQEPKKSRKTYTQEYRSRCVSRTYTRTCLSNQGLYVKETPPGVCVAQTPVPDVGDQESQLMQLTATRPECPEDYTINWDNPNCQCQGC